MALVLGDNFSYGGAKPLDARLKYSTVAEMKAVGDSTMYDGCLAYCSATDKTYQWKSTNSVDETLGRWREFETGGGSGGTTDYADLDNKPQINENTLSGNKTSSELGLASKEDMDKAYKSDDIAFTDIADGDYIPVYDTSATAKKKSLWSNIKAKLKTYFDTLYDLNKNDIPMYGTSSTGASTTAKVATVSRGTFTLVAGAKVTVKFTYTNTASAPTLNVGSTGAKAIKLIDSDGTVMTPSTWWGAGDVVTFVYDGTYWIMQPAFSTLPSIPVVGTINRSDIFTTTEKVVGCWTDGRPIYQKTVQMTSPTCTTDGAEVNVTTDIGATVSSIVSITAISNTSGSWKTLDQINANVSNNKLGRLYVQAYSNESSSSDYKNKIRLINGKTTYSNLPVYITLQYTKTTDSANSYNYANENDYSTTEKIVGTWIDGKTLYQKTINFGALPNNTTKTVAHGISNLANIIDIKGWFNKNTIWGGLSYASSYENATNGVEVYVSGANVAIRTVKDQSTFTTCYITLQYTKT